MLEYLVLYNSQSGNTKNSGGLCLLCSAGELKRSHRHYDRKNVYQRRAFISSASVSTGAHAL